ncbi:MAG: hypothetical protein KDC53_00180 [Saprospiraceae bacterium]|nr:hypothetical protein [Saprospiraceae bacterium]
MDVNSFKSSLTREAPPPEYNQILRALWYDGKGDWEIAHEIAQEISGSSGSHIHAYLHRKEGDDWNAGYWYRQAGQPVPKISLNEEWENLVEHYLG